MSALRAITILTFVTLLVSSGCATRNMGFCVTWPFRCYRAPDCETGACASVPPPVIARAPCGPNGSLFGPPPSSASYGYAPPTGYYPPSGNRSVLSAPPPSGMAYAPPPASSHLFPSPPPNANVVPSSPPPGYHGQPPVASLDWQSSPPPGRSTHLLPPDAGRSGEKPLRDENVTPAEFPVDIPQFQPEVYTKVSAGLQPRREGYTWLANHGYRTVLNLKTPSEDDSAIRRDVERAGLKYLSLEIGENTLTRPTITEFGRIVSDSAGYKLFVMDKDGPLAGVVWYLQFVLNEQLPEASARKQARALGLRDEIGERLWEAALKLTSESRP